MNRLDHGEQKVLPRWQQLGWTREPRNGHESKLVREGKPQPKAWTKRYTCSKCGGHQFKTTRNFDQRRKKTYEVRYCTPCRVKSNRAYEDRHPEKTRKWRQDQIDKVRAQVADFDSDGIAHVTATWFIRHQIDVLEALVAGKQFVVEYGGEPTYRVVRYGTA